MAVWAHNKNWLHGPTSRYSDCRKEGGWGRGGEEGGGRLSLSLEQLHLPCKNEPWPSSAPVTTHPQGRCPSNTTGLNKDLSHIPNISLGLINLLNAELNPICYLLALLGAHHFLHVSRIRVKSLTLRLLTSYIYIYGAPILDVSRSHTTTHHSR